VWANGALHHLKDLERVVQSIYCAIKPGGILVSNEYVGPRYQQIGARQQEIINAAVHLLPALFREEPPESWFHKLKRRLFPDGERRLFGQVWRPTPLSYFVDTDPSECVHSDLIVPTLKKVFDRVEVRYFGGSILFYALGEKFYDRFDMNNGHHRMFLEMLFNIEDVMIETGEIAPDNAHIICWKDGSLLV
jgi:SAM-dependent methyltransferase